MKPVRKIKVIKPFAGFSEGYYIYDEEEEGYYFDRDDSIFIHKDIVEGMKSNFEEIKARPISREDLGEVSGYYIDASSNIIPSNSLTKEWNFNVFKTKKQAEACIALAQIIQLLDRYDIPENSNTWYWKEKNNTIGSGDIYKIKRNGLLRFDTEDKLEHFYKYHKELIKKLSPFYIK